MLIELAAAPSLGSLVFCYAGQDQDGLALDRINGAARKALLLSSTALIDMTRVDGRVFVKFTLMNSFTTLADIANVLLLFRQAVAACR